MGAALVDWINKGHQRNLFNIETVEQKYDAIFVADLSIRVKNGNWSEQTFPIFYQPVLKDPKHKHYFTLFEKEKLIYITDASSVAEVIWHGSRADNGEIIFSRSYHDYCESEDGTAMCDGGQEYFRGSGQPVALKIIGPDFQVVDGQEAT